MAGGSRRGRELREPWSVLRRGLLGGAVGGGLLGALVQGSDAFVIARASAPFITTRR